MGIALGKRACTAGPDLTFPWEELIANHYETHGNRVLETVFVSPVQAGVFGKMFGQQLQADAGAFGEVGSI